MGSATRHLRRIGRIAAIAALLAASTIGGMSVALLAASEDRHTTSFGTLDARVVPDLDGRVVVYVPLVDWRVELLEHRAPATIEIALRGIDRERAGAGISSAGAANQSLGDVRRDSEQVVERAVRRAVVVAGIGGAVGALFAGALLAGTLLRRRWLLVAPAFGVAVVALVLVPSVQSMRDLGSAQVEVTAAGGNAEELPVVLRFAEQLLYVGDEYEQHYRTALRSVARLAAFTRGDGGVEFDGSALLISDLHDNAFVLDALDDFAGDDTVFAVGDYVQVGARLEERLAGRLAGVGGELVAVSGNHDTAEYMDALEDGGARVLDDDDPTTEVDGLLVAGWPDPLERRPGSDGEHRLRVYGAEYAEQRAAFLEWWEDLEERPDVVLVHQHGFAHALLDHLREVGDDGPLVVLTGHDHKPHVHVSGQHAIVDAGTLGAGGVVAVGEQDASFARLNLADGRIVSVDLVSIEPLTGRAATERTQLVAARSAGR